MRIGCHGDTTGFSNTSGYLHLIQFPTKAKKNSKTLPEMNSIFEAFYSITFSISFHPNLWAFFFEVQQL